MKPPYFGSNKPSLPPNLPNRLIIPSALPFDLKIEIMFNTKNGNTELRLYDLTGMNSRQINLMQVAGVLAEHTSSLMRQLMSGKPIETTPIEVDPNAGGSTNGEQPKA